MAGMMATVTVAVVTVMAAASQWQRWCGGMAVWRHGGEGSGVEGAEAGSGDDGGVGGGGVICGGGGSSGGGAGRHGSVGGGGVEGSDDCAGGDSGGDGCS
jgi:hypothetical protein